MNTKVDVFPSFLHEGDVPKLHHPHKDDFQDLMDQKKIQSFICFLNAKKVSYITVEMTTQLKQHFGRIAEGSHTIQVGEPRISGHLWSDIQRRLSNPLKDTKKYSDVRCLFNHDFNYFLVKPLFTFGFRTVEKNQIHIIQLGKSPLILFMKPDNENPQGHSDRGFEPLYQSHYKKYLLKSGKCYSLPEGSVYMLVAIVTAYFSLHVVSKDHTISFDVIKITENKKNKNENYLDRAPPTPSLKERIEGRKNESSSKRKALKSLPEMPPPGAIPKKRKEQTTNHQTLHNDSQSLHNDTRQTLHNDSQTLHNDTSQTLHNDSRDLPSTSQTLHNENTNPSQNIDSDSETALHTTTQINLEEASFNQNNTTVYQIENDDVITFLRNIFPLEQTTKTNFAFHHQKLYDFKIYTKPEVYNPEICQCKMLVKQKAPPSNLNVEPMDLSLNKTDTSQCPPSPARSDELHQTDTSQSGNDINPIHFQTSENGSNPTGLLSHNNQVPSNVNLDINHSANERNIEESWVEWMLTPNFNIRFNQDDL